MTMRDWIELGLLIAAVLVIGIPLIIKAFKNKWIDQLYDTVKIAIKEAEEKFGAGKGAEKQQFVLDAAKEKCIELGIPYAMLENYINKIIKTVVDGYNVIAKK